MIAETDPTQREEALTETGQNSALVPETALEDSKYAAGVRRIVASNAQGGIYGNKGVVVEGWDMVGPGDNGVWGGGGSTTDKMVALSLVGNGVMFSLSVTLEYRSGPHLGAISRLMFQSEIHAS
ncbi:hypothetical protein Tco_0529839 [Tanacetum coccineum]